MITSTSIGAEKTEGRADDRDRVVIVRELMG
jgi:hypothetical protein